MQLQIKLSKGLTAMLKNGGNIIFGIRSGFSNENCKVRSSVQPGIISECCGVKYHLFTDCGNASLDNGGELSGWIELLETDGADSLIGYNHPEWKDYSAVTHNIFGKGSATYIGCFPDEKVMSEIISTVFEKCGLLKKEQSLNFPIIIRKGQNESGREINFIFNYSSVEQRFTNIFF